MTADDLIKAAVESDEAFIKELARIIKDELRITASEFSEKSGIPASTIYKLLSGHREPNIKTLRQIVSVLRKLEVKLDINEKSGFIAVIAARPVLDLITEKKLKVRDRRCKSSGLRTNSQYHDRKGAADTCNIHYAQGQSF